MMMMIPEAFGPRYHISTDKRAFYEYHAAIMEPWDGPAAMVFTDGRLVGGTLDRNGLRPCRYVVTTDGLVVLASEVGVIEFPPEQIQQKGPASARPHVPGRHRRRPHRRRQRDQGQDLAAEAVSPLAGGEPHRAARPVPAGQARRRSTPRRWPSGCGRSATRAKSCRWSLAPMAANGQEPVGSMGTDTPLAVLSSRPKLLFNYFKQLFAQVTNPPIDPLREGLVMSLMSFTGKQRNLLDETPEHCRQLKLPHPILTNEDMERLRTVERERLQGGHAAGAVSTADDGRRRGRASGARRWTNWSTRPSRRSRDGASLLIVSDRDVSPKHGADPEPAGHGGPAPRPAGPRRLRGEAGIVVESGEPREVMHFCLLCGYGANAINPYLAFEAIHEAARRRRSAGRRCRSTS